MSHESQDVDFAVAGHSIICSKFCLGQHQSYHVNNTGPCYGGNHQELVRVSRYHDAITMLYTFNTIPVTVVHFIQYLSTEFHVS